jgi:GNAT superfamily N-acetyltransferase
VELIAPSTAEARYVLRCYMNEVVSRYYGRRATEEEIDAAIREDPSDDLALPHGALLVGHEDEAICGCAGPRFLPDGVGEVKRLFIAPAARRRSLGTRLMGELECLAREHDYPRCV